MIQPHSGPSEAPGPARTQLSSFSFSFNELQFQSPSAFQYSCLSKAQVLRLSTVSYPGSAHCQPQFPLCVPVCFVCILGRQLQPCPQRTPFSGSTAGGTFDLQAELWPCSLHPTLKPAWLPDLRQLLNGPSVWLLLAPTPAHLGRWVWVLAGTYTKGPDIMENRRIYYLLLQVQSHSNAVTPGCPLASCPSPRPLTSVMQSFPYLLPPTNPAPPNTLGLGPQWPFLNAVFC